MDRSLSSKSNIGADQWNKEAQVERMLSSDRNLWKWDRNAVKGI
jgi:hypothetical protein